MKKWRDGLAQVEQTHRAPGHMKRIEERKGTGRALSIKHLTQNYPPLWSVRVTDEYWFAAEVTQRWRLIDVTGCLLGPIRMDELIEKFPASTTRGANTE